MSDKHSTDCSCIRCQEASRDANREQEESELAPGSTFYPLFEHMSHEHGLTLSESEIAEIIHVADKMRMQQSGVVQWILINALHHLDGDQLKELLHEISKRINNPKYHPPDCCAPVED